jgi:hypothetical protein
MARSGRYAELVEHQLQNDEPSESAEPNEGGEPNDEKLA